MYVNNGITRAERDAKARTIEIHVDPTKVKRGHQAHRGGSGTMGDRRLKRLNTRGSQRRAAMADQ